MSDETPTRYEVRTALGETLERTETEQEAWAVARLWSGRTVHRVETQVGPALPRPVEKWVVKNRLGEDAARPCSKGAAEGFALYANEELNGGPYVASQVTP